MLRRSPAESEPHDPARGQADYDSDDDGTSTEQLAAVSPDADHSSTASPTHSLLPPAATGPPLPLTSWVRIRRNLPGWEHLLMLVFVAGCIYYMKTVDLSSRFAKQGTQSATKQNTPVRSSTDRSAAGVSATPQQPVDIEYTRQLNSLVASLNTDLAPSDASHSLAQLGIDLHFEPYAFPKGLGVRGTIRTENAASLISSADPSLRFTTLSPLLPSLRRLAFVHRYISTGDPSTDDPASAFHQDHAFCSGKRQQGRGGGKGKEKGRKRKGGGDAVGRRCRRARFKDLEQLWREAPAAVWPLVQEAVIDVVDERITKGTPQDPDAYARLRERKMWRSGLLKVQIDPK